MIPHVLGTLISKSPGTLTGHVLGDMRGEGTVNLIGKGIDIMSAIQFSD